LTYNPKMKGLKPMTGTKKEDMLSKSRKYSVVKCSAHNPKNKGSNLTTGTRRDILWFGKSHKNKVLE
jgi:hypothetical protein